MSSPIDDIKQRLDLVDLIQEYVKLNPAGSNFKAKCPFHNEKTASFMVSPEKQIWHCFGCSAGGDHFEFIKRVEGVEFPEALRILAKRANVKLEYHDPEQHNQKTRLLDLLRDLAEHWHEVLLNSPAAQPVRDYLAQHQVSPESVDAFQLGYAKDAWDDAIQFLQNKKYSLREIELAGVSKAGDKNKPYDRMRNRLMFPIRSIHGNTVGFTGRTMAKEFTGGKYINSPQTEVYNKSLILYNLDSAKQEIRRQDYAILVEGNMDALSAFQAGTKNVVAVSGTALTAEQIKLIQRFTQNVMIAFDADVAGTKANLRGIDLAWQAGLNVKVVHLPKGQDPDDLIRQSAEKWKEALRTARNFMDYVFEVTLSDLDVARVDHKKQAAKKLLAVIGKLGDAVEQSHYLKKLAAILEVTEAALAKTLEQVAVKAKKPKADRPLPEAAPLINHNQSVAERLLALALRFPEYFAEVLKHLEPAEILFAPAMNLYKAMIIYYNKEHNLDLPELEAFVEAESKDYLNRLSLLIDQEALDLTTRELQREISQLTKRLKKESLNIQLREIPQLIFKAEQANDAEAVNRLSERFSVLTSQLNEL